MWCFTALDPVHPRCHWSSEEKDYGEMVNSLLDENKKLEDTEFFFWDHSFPFPMFFFQYSSPPVQKNHFNHKEFKKMYIHIYIYIHMFWNNLPSFNIHWWLFSFTPQRLSFKVCHIHLFGSGQLGGVAETHGMSSWQLGIQLSWQGLSDLVHLAKVGRFDALMVDEEN